MFSWLLRCNNRGSGVDTTNCPISFEHSENCDWLFQVSAFCLLKKSNSNQLHGVGWSYKLVYGLDIWQLVHI